jgi:hypothetical protein
MEEVLIKSHLIVTNIHEEYHINWCGKIADAKPKFKNGKPIFTIVGGGNRMELNTTDMARIEKCAKLCTQPKGRQAVTTDTARIYIVEENDNEKLLGILTHNHVKTFAPMYDSVGWR